METKDNQIIQGYLDESRKKKRKKRFGWFDYSDEFLTPSENRFKVTSGK